MKGLYLNSIAQTIQKLSFIVLLSVSTYGIAQAQKTIKVPLTKPNKPGKLQMTTTFGAIKVVATTVQKSGCRLLLLLLKKRHKIRVGSNVLPMAR